MDISKKINRVFHYHRNKLRFDFLKHAMAEKVKLAEEWKRLYSVDYAIDSIMKELISKDKIG